VSSVGPFLLFRPERFDLFRGKKEAMARESQKAQISSRVIIQNDRQMDSVFIVLLDGLDGAGSACELTVENVPAFSWPQPDTIAWPEVRLEDADVFQGSFLFQKAPFPFVHRFSPQNRRRRRAAPWSFINRF
jgi:hypothetical protein